MVGGVNLLVHQNVMVGILNMGADLRGEVSRTVIVQLHSQLENTLPSPKPDERPGDSASAKFLFQNRALKRNKTSQSKLGMTDIVVKTE